MKGYIKNLRTATEKLTRWDSSKQSFGHLGDLGTIKDRKKKTDRIYEFYCVLRILDDLRQHYEIKLIAGAGGKKVFPKGPALKKGWSRFTIQSKIDSNNAFQICYGTKVKLSGAPATTIAADISFQTFDASEDPDESMVVLIMDPKYKHDSETSLSIDTLHDFHGRIDSLKVQNAGTIVLEFDKFPELKGNCLLTNGRPILLHRDYCILFGIKQVGRFDIGPDPIEVVG